jgi:hypothetical protein
VSGGAWRIRGTAALGVALFLAATGLALPDPAARSAVQYPFVIALGYGHLIGAAWFSARRMAARVPSGVPPALAALLAAAGGALLLALYLRVLAGGATAALLFLALLAVSAWHVVENDLALASGTIGPLPRGLRRHALALGVTGLVVALAAATLGLPVAGARAALAARGIAFGDVFSAVTLHHLLAFLALFGERMRAADPRARRALARRLLLAHGPPALACGALLVAPGGQLETLRELVFSPAIYLFWSVLHVAQTGVARGLAPRERKP